MHLGPGYCPAAPVGAGLMVLPESGGRARFAALPPAIILPPLSGLGLLGPGRRVGQKSRPTWPWKEGRSKEQAYLALEGG